MKRVRLAVCVDNTGYPVALEPGKLYEVLPDPEARAHGELRVIDESGEDYLFPADLFLTGIRFPWKKARQKRVTLFSSGAIARKNSKTVGAGTRKKS